MRTTEHAAARMHQRAIPPLIVEWLTEFGTELHAGGAVKRYFDKDARKRLTKAIGPQIVDRLGNLLNVYIVVNDDTLITAAHRRKSMRRK